MKLDNYFFVTKGDPMRADDVVILKPENAHAIGIVAGRPGFPDGSLITTSRIMRSTPSSIITISGSEYELGNPHPDFVELKKALEENVPIITDWCLDYKQELSGKLFQTEKHISGKIIARDGNNYVTIEEKFTHRRTKFFVIWRNMSFVMKGMIVLRGSNGEVFGTNYEDFREQFSLKCVPAFAFA